MKRRIARCTFSLKFFSSRTPEAGTTLRARLDHVSRTVGVCSTEKSRAASSELRPLASTARTEAWCGPVSETRGTHSSVVSIGRAPSNLTIYLAAGPLRGASQQKRCAGGCGFHIVGNHKPIAIAEMPAATSGTTRRALIRPARACMLAVVRPENDKSAGETPAAVTYANVDVRRRCPSDGRLLCHGWRDESGGAPETPHRPMRTFGRFFAAP